HVATAALRVRETLAGAPPRPRDARHVSVLQTIPDRARAAPLALGGRRRRAPPATRRGRGRRLAPVQAPAVARPSRTGRKSAPAAGRDAEERGRYAGAEARNAAAAGPRSRPVHAGRRPGAAEAGPGRQGYPDGHGDAEGLPRPDRRRAAQPAGRRD